MTVVKHYDIPPPNAPAPCTWVGLLSEFEKDPGTAVAIELDDLADFCRDLKRYLVGMGYEI